MQGHLLSYRVGNTPGTRANHYYLLESIGTVLATTDAAGALDATHYYDPFGAGTSATGTPAASNRFRFASGWLNPTGSYHYGQRSYNPTLAPPDPTRPHHRHHHPTQNHQPLPIRGRRPHQQHRPQRPGHL